MVYSLYVHFVAGIIRLGLILGLVSGYSVVKDYYQGKAHQSVKRGMINLKSINNHFYGKRNYNKYKDYREIMKEQGYE